jgi:peptidoglycan hydrolase-like amidase
LVFCSEFKTLVVNYLDLEDYVLGVVPLEIGLKNEYFFQALKCAAVTAEHLL